MQFIFVRNKSFPVLNIELSFVSPNKLNCILFKLLNCLSFTVIQFLILFFEYCKFVIAYLLSVKIEIVYNILIWLDIRNPESILRQFDLGKAFDSLFLYLTMQRLNSMIKEERKKI